IRYESPEAGVPLLPNQPAVAGRKLRMYGVPSVGVPFVQEVTLTFNPAVPAPVAPPAIAGVPSVATWTVPPGNGSVAMSLTFWAYAVGDPQFAPVFGSLLPELVSVIAVAL